MAHFKKVTLTPPAPGLVNVVIMGRTTWESIPTKFRPLDGRINVVLTRQSSLEGCEDDSIVVASSFENALEQLKVRPNVGSIFCIGGGQVYQEAIDSGLVQRVLYTEVMNPPNDVKMDAFFPELLKSEWDCVTYCEADKENVENASTTPNEAKIHVDRKSGIEYRFLDYKRRSNPAESPKAPVPIEEGAHLNPEEMQYLELCRDIMENGVRIVWL
jgi:dihydrofolate reductase